ncbi:MAG: manganese efflux pump MntP family protein [Candidatus Omnitrophica bacterium]|nr:manganese efflux pump MntP family protein [Candidatus Omnitrophota bacterium]
MDIIAVFFIALGLALDCFAVAVSAGMSGKGLSARDAFTMALFFGGFQAAMPIAGWWAGTAVYGFISGFDHWVAFGLLSLIGVKMTFDAIFGREGRTPRRIGPGTLVVLALATSIDALAAGISFAFLRMPITVPVVIIGLVSFCMSLAGAFLGRKVGLLFARTAEVAGGFVLIAIGAKILIQHLGL